MAERIGDNVVRDALRRGRYIFSVAFALSFVFNLLRLTGPLFMLLIYDRVLSSRSEETLVVLFILVVIFMFVMGLVDYSRRRILARLGAQFQEKIEERIFSTTTKDKFFVPAQNKPADGLGDLDALRGFFNSSALIAFLDFVWAPMFLAVVFSFNWILGWVAVGGLGLLLVLNLVKTAFSKGRDEQKKEASKKISGLKDMMLVSREIIRSQEMTSSFKERWQLARQSSRDSSIELSDWTTWFFIFSRQIRMLLQYTILATGAYLTVKGQLTVGAMVASMFLSVRVFIPVEQFIKQLPTIKRAIVDWGRLKKKLASKNAVPNNEDLWNLEPSLSLSAVSTRSPLTRLQILKSVNLTVDPGTMLEIEGKSGSGKTVLAETLLGIWPKSAGTILCGGANIERLSSQQAGIMFGYVPESANLINGTIEENISRLALKTDKEKVFAAAKLAQVHDMIMALPDGYQTMIDAANASFSKGQRHQFSLARALYEEPKILIIDEPDLSLREALSKNLKKTMDDFKSRGCIIIIFSRKPLLLSNSDRRLLLENGRLRDIKIKAVENVIDLGKNKVKKKVTNLVSS